MTMQRAGSALISGLTSARAKRGRGRCGRTRVEASPGPNPNRGWRTRALCCEPIALDALPPLARSRRRGPMCSICFCRMQYAMPIPGLVFPHASLYSAASCVLHD
jgi:hypothetical protein